MGWLLERLAVGGWMPGRTARHFNRIGRGHHPACARSTRRAGRPLSAHVRRSIDGSASASAGRRWLAVAGMARGARAGGVSVAGTGAGRGPAGTRRSGRGLRRAALPLAGGSPRRVGSDRRQLSGHVRRQPVGFGGRPRGNRLRRRAVPARRRHQRARVAPRRSAARPLHRARPADRPRALARSGRRDAHRHAEHAGHADAGRALSHRRRAGSGRRRRSPCAKAKRKSRSRATCSRRFRARRWWSTGADAPSPTSATRRASTASTPGAPTATGATIARDRRPTSRGRWSGTRISTSTDRGRPIPTTAPSGSRRPSRRAGRRIATATGRRSGHGARRGSTMRLGLCAVPLRALGVHRRSLGMVPRRVREASGLGAGARRLVRRIELGRAPSGMARRSTAGCRSGWREAYHPAWRQCSYNCWARYNRPYAVNVAVRPSAPPARYANLAVPGAMSAVTAATLVGSRPVTSNLLERSGTARDLSARHGERATAGAAAASAARAERRRRPGRSAGRRIHVREDAAARTGQSAREAPVLPCAGGTAATTAPTGRDQACTRD